MPRTALKVVLCLSLIATCVGCAGTKKDPKAAQPAPMSVQEAKQVVAEIGAEGGFTQQTGTPPASIADVREIVRTDQLGRFQAARVYAARLSGVDALGLRATLEVLWADALLSVADLFHEVSLRRQSDLRTLEATRETMDTEEADRLIDERKRQIAEADRSVQALRTLAEPHLDAAHELAKEAQRQASQSRVGYLPGAHVGLLRRRWTEFDLAIRKAEALESEPSTYALYLRALERAMRFGQREEARRGLEELVAGHPEVGRARARLVLLEDTPIARHAQLEQLKLHSPGHPIVLLAGPGIEREYVVSTELQAAAVETELGSEQPSGSTPAPEASATPAAPGDPEVYEAMQAPAAEGAEPSE